MKNTARYLLRITCPRRTGLVATAHHVTADSDEDPIIDQEVARVNHTFGLDQLLTTGRNMENYAPARAVIAHSEHCVFLNGHKTVVLK